MKSFKVKAIRFSAQAPSSYAGQTRWIAAKLTATGRASVWCRHYHDSEAEANQCGNLLVSEGEV